MIEDLNEHVENINSKWQRFLAFKIKIDEEIEETDESDEEAISSDKVDPQVKREISATDFVVEVPATTSCDETKLSKITKVTKHLRLIGKQHC